MATTAKDQQAAKAEDKTEDPRDAEIERLRRELEEARRAVPAVTSMSGPVTFLGQPVRLKVEPPHSELHFAGHVIGTEYTEVPGHLAAAFTTAAADAGVTLTQDQEG